MKALSNYLPRTQHRELAVAIVVTTLLFVAEALFPLTGNPGVGDAILGCFLVAVAVGLWKLNRVARIAAVSWLWIVTFVLTFGTLNPLMFADVARANHGEAPNVWLIAAKVAPFTVIGLCLIYVLGKYKAEFGRKADVQ